MFGPESVTQKIETKLVILEYLVAVQVPDLTTTMSHCGVLRQRTSLSKAILLDTL